MIPSPPLLLWTNVITYNTLNNTFTTILPAYQYWNYHTWKNKTIHSQVIYMYIAPVDSYKKLHTCFHVFCLHAYYAKPWISLLPQHSRQVGKTSLEVLKVRLHLSYSQVIPTNCQLFTFLCKLKKRLLLNSENDLPMFRLNAPVVICMKLEHSVETSVSYFPSSSW